MGRPSIRTPEMIEAILDRIANGELGPDICKDEGMPSWATVRRWREEDEEFRAAYARAHEAGVEHDEADAHREAMRRPEDSVDAQAQRTRLDWLKWRLSKRLPKDFGDRQHIEHSGAIADGLTDEQRAKRMAEILRAAKARKSPTTATEQSGEVAARVSKMPKNPKP